METGEEDKAWFDWHDRTVRRIREEMAEGYQHPIGLGYAKLELDDLEEQRRERMLRIFSVVGSAHLKHR